MISPQFFTTSSKDKGGSDIKAYPYKNSTHTYLPKGPLLTLEVKVTFQQNIDKLYYKINSV